MCNTGLFLSHYIQFTSYPFHNYENCTYRIEKDLPWVPNQTLTERSLHFSDVSLLLKEGKCIRSLHFKRQLSLEYFCSVVNFHPFFCCNSLSTSQSTSTAEEDLDDATFLVTLYVCGKSCHDTRSLLLCRLNSTDVLL